MQGVLDRIKQYVDYKGISVRRFEQKVGMSNGSFASQLKNKKTIGVDRLENILKEYPELNPSWVLTGEGKMLKNSPFSTSEQGEMATILKEKYDELVEKYAAVQEELNGVYAKYAAVLELRGDYVSLSS
ncbi:MAG: hypothetical protein LBU92_05560 [Prevotellaceae bacterium]|jgi:transcriptional regulator with XRE-family HTH domain|nr:hypothetical protein [Prevotellaceae bacterium]